MKAKNNIFALDFSYTKFAVVLSVFVILFSLLAPLKVSAADPVAPEPQSTPTNSSGTTQNSTTNSQPTIFTPTNQQQNQTSTNQSTGQSASQSGVETCEKAAGPLSFFLCPFYNLIVKAINWLAGPEDSVLTGMLRVDPLQFSKDQGLLKAYQNVLTFTNGLFILVFFVIIILGLIRDFSFLDNYNFKTVLPRFIAAIIIAQFGYFLCAAAIDIGNILGTILPNTIMDGVLPGVPPPALTDGIISLLAFGDANSVGTGTATTTNLLFGGANGVVFILLFIMSIIVLFALLLAFIYMVARYLILYILILAAPLAFLAWVLPGTQPFFFKWGRNLIRLILMFPLVVVVITVAQLLSFMLIHPNLDPNVITDDRFKLIIGALVPFVALLMIPKCLKMSGDLMDVTGGAVAGFVAGKAANKDHAKNAGKYSKEGIQNRIAYDDKLSKSTFGRVAVAGVGGFSSKNPNAAVKIGQTRDRAQATYDKIAANNTPDELKKMLRQNYTPAKIAAITAIAKTGDRDTVKEALSSGLVNQSQLDYSVKKDFDAYKSMPDMRSYFDPQPKKDAAFSNMTSKSLSEVSPATMKDWFGKEEKNAAGVKEFQLIPSHLNKFTPAQYRTFFNDKAARSSVSADISRTLANYAHTTPAANRNDIQKAIVDTIKPNGEWANQ